MNEELTTYTPDVPQNEGMMLSRPENQDAMLVRAEARAKRNNILMKEAQMYSGSEIIPRNYQGKAADCFIAVDMAERMGMSPIFIMQNMYVVQGKPSWSGQACITLIENSGKFATSPKFVFVGTEGNDDWGCYCEAERKDTGEVLRGTTVTMKMAKGEGWADKSGSKWKTMPEQMMKYRSAAFFARTYCPEALMGLSVADEGEDTRPNREPVATALTEALKAEMEDPEPEPIVFDMPDDEPSYMDAEEYDADQQTIG